jgi:hypothetical protein
MATQPRFSFDFAELRRPAAALEVLPAATEDLPPDAALVAPEPRPRWIEPLPAYFGAGEPLRVELARGGSFGTLLLSALAGLFASAGQDAGLDVRRWATGLAVGPPGFASIGKAPHAVLVPCELTPGDVAATSACLRAHQADGPWLILGRRKPGLDAAFGLREEPFSAVPGERFWRLADLDTGELRALAEGRAPALGLGPFSRRCLELAAGIVRHYRGRWR